MKDLLLCFTDSTLDFESSFKEARFLDTTQLISTGFINILATGPLAGLHFGLFCAGDSNKGEGGFALMDLGRGRACDDEISIELLRDIDTGDMGEIGDDSWGKVSEETGSFGVQVWVEMLVSEYTVGCLGSATVALVWESVEDDVVVFVVVVLLVLIVLAIEVSDRDMGDISLVSGVF